MYCFNSRFRYFVLGNHTEKFEVSLCILVYVNQIMKKLIGLENYSKELLRSKGFLLSISVTLYYSSYK